MMTEAACSLDVAITKALLGSYREMRLLSLGESTTHMPAAALSNKLKAPIAVR